ADPPRSGLGSLTGSLPESSCLVLVSCSLPSLVRDVRALIEDGWEVSSVQPFDMFAQTSHVEIATTLHRH
ncbi:MAG: hypothetical protein KDD44_13665, partial [Bdellovibrionales bacterium]|nr:hypothetical protein [Bdellovibrionales bacterium]